MVNTTKKMHSLDKRRGQRVLQRFKEEAISGVNDPKLLEVLRFVSDYWKDYFRPAFASRCCEAVGGRVEAADEVSLMITLMSAGGGIHDDIVDKSIHKHFRTTVLGEYGIDVAVLVGDLLILKGWTLARNLVDKYSHPRKLHKVVEAFGSWTLEVCEAEFMEIQCRQNLETKLEHYQDILSKSMADTTACARLGAIVGGGSESEIQGLARFGNRLGFMYRLTNDLKDTLNVELNLSDRLRHESVPLPILYAASQSEQRKSAIKEIFEKLGENSLNLDKLLKHCHETKAFEYVFKVGKETFGEALISLGKLKPSLSKSALTQMIKGSLTEITNLTNLR
jgi:geranylgeranyl diphosphate synthase type I